MAHCLVLILEDIEKITTLKDAIVTDRKKNLGATHFLQNGRGDFSMRLAIQSLAKHVSE